MINTKEELAKIWAEQNNIVGSNPWFDPEQTYYNLTVEQILRMADYITDNL